MPLLKHAPQGRIILLRQTLYNRGRPALGSSQAYAFIVVNFLYISKPYILAYGHFIAHKILEDDAHMPAYIQCIVVFQGQTVEEYLSCSGFVEARQQFHQRRFSRAIVTNQRDAFACFEKEIEIL